VRGIESRGLGSAVTLRPNKDSARNAIVIGDPTNTVLSDGVVSGWQIYAKIVSIEHRVFLQVWRPSSSSSLSSSPPPPPPPPSSPSSSSSSLHLSSEGVYTLVGQTYVEPTELRFHEIVLQASEFIRVAAGDVIGLYFVAFNPVGWSAVPCASARQRYAYVRSPVNVTVGSSFHFRSAASGRNACRYYSFAALFGTYTQFGLAVAVAQFVA